MEKRGTCPIRLDWLKAMIEVLPPEILARSKLAPYLHCLELPLPEQSESKKKE